MVFIGDLGGTLQICHATLEIKDCIFKMVKCMFSRYFVGKFENVLEMHGIYGKNVKRPWEDDVQSLGDVITEQQDIWGRGNHAKGSKNALGSNTICLPSTDIERSNQGS